MIGQFFRWWLTQLRALLPFVRGKDAGQWLDVTIDAERVRAVLSDRADRVLMDVAREQSAQLKAELSTIAASLDLSRARCRVWVSDSEVLGRELELPLAAEENLREVLSFEMARKTPFRAQDVYFDALVTQRDPARRMLGLRLNVVPRRVLDAVIAALDSWSPQAVSSASAARDAQRKQQAVFAFQSASFSQPSHSGLNLTLALMVLVMASLSAWLPFKAQQHAREQLQAQEQSARAEASQAMALRDEFDAVQRASTYLADAQAARPPMVQIVEELSRALPDSTYLSRLQVEDGEVNLHGSSQAASELIAILEQLTLLEGVRFASPVTRDAASGGERFHIVARLAAATGATAAPANKERS